MVNLASFWKPVISGQTVLPDTSLLKGQKLVKNAKNAKKFKYDIFSNFQTLCYGEFTKVEPTFFHENHEN